MKFKLHLIVTSFVLFLLMVFVFADSFEILSAQTTSSVVLTWTDNSLDESGFYIERATGSGTFSQIGSVSANIQQYTDSTVSSSSTYSYRISAYNSFIQSSFSNTIQITVPSSSSSIPSSGGSAGGGSSSTSGGSSGGLTGSVIQNTPNDSSSSSSSSQNSDSSSSNDAGSSIGTIAGRAIDGDSEALKELSPLAIYIILAILLGLVFFIVAKKYMNND